LGPSGLAFGPGGDLYVSEGPPGNLVRFSPDGVRHPVANGLNQPQGLTFGPQGLPHVAELGGNRVSQVGGSGTVTSFVTVTAPIDLAFAGADLLVSTETGALWRATPDGTTALFAQGPDNAAGIALAPDGSVVAAFGADNSIYRFTDGGTTPGVDLAAPAPAFGRSGQAITHTFTLRNTGNGQDGFRLSATSERGWPLSILGGAHAGPLHCGQAHDIQIAVMVPPGTALGITDTLVLTATSRLDADVLASTRVTTVSGYELYLPITLDDF
jgi:hypothetical protein